MKIIKTSYCLFFIPFALILRKTVHSESNRISSFIETRSIPTIGDCDEILKQGIFNTTFINQSSTSSKAFEKYIYKKDFETHDEAINAGISVGVPVYGIPVEIGGVFSKSAKDTWKKQHQEYANEKTTLVELYQFLKKEVSPEIVLAWSNCSIGVNRSNAYGLIMSTEKAKDLITVQVSWKELPGTKSHNKPKVLNSLIINGKNVSTHSETLYQKNTVLMDGYQTNSVFIRPTDPFEDVFISLTTDRGTVTAFALGKVRQPQIKTFNAVDDKVNYGDEIELYWDVTQADKVEINGIEQTEVQGSTKFKASNAGATQDFILIATNAQGGKSQKMVKVGVRPRPVITGIELYGKTLDDDKDHNSNVTLRIDGPNGEVAFGNDDTHNFKDNDPFSVNLRVKSADFNYDHIKTGTAVFGFGTVGNDTWKFEAKLKITWSEGNPSIIDLGAHTLSNDNQRDWSPAFSVPPIQ